MAALFRESARAVELQGDGYAADLTALSAPPGWSAGLIPTGSFPLKRPNAKALAAVWSDLLEGLTSKGLTAEVILETRGLSQGDHSKRLSDHATEWIPEQGLCVEPQKGPPSLWNWTDFLFRHRSEPHVGQPPFAMHLTGEADARLQSVSVMAGTGALQVIFLSGKWEEFTGRTAETLGQGIKEPAFQAMPWQVPALTKKSVEAADADTLEDWTGGAAALVRESREDRGVLVVVRESAATIDSLLKRRVRP